MKTSLICEKNPRSAQIARPMPIGHAQARKTFEARPIFCHVKKKKTLDLQISSQIDKTMKKLH